MPNLVGKKAEIGLRFGIVEDVTGDENKCNNIKVKLWGSGIILENVPIACDMASKEFGRVVIPKKGDNVLVGFADSDIEQPIVIGSFYDPSKKPPIVIDEKNNINYFKTATGIEITINDNKDDAGLFVKTKDGHKLQLEDNSNKVVTIADKDDKTVFKIDLKDSKIEMKCKDMKITAEERVCIKVGGTKVEFKDSSGVSMQSDKGNMNMKFNNIKGEAKDNTEFKSNAKIKVASSGMTEIGGSLVKIG